MFYTDGYAVYPTALEKQIENMKMNYKETY